MEPCRRSRRRGSRRRGGTRMRRRPRRCGWCAPCERSWAPSTARSSGSRPSWATGRVGASVGQAGRDRRRSRAGVEYVGAGPDQGARAGGPRTAASERDPEEGSQFLRGGARPPTPQVVAFIDANRGVVVDDFTLTVESICTVLAGAGVKVAVSTYYAFKARPASARAQADASCGRRCEGCGRTTTASTVHGSCGRPLVGPGTTSGVTRSPGSCAPRACRAPPGRSGCARRVPTRSRRGIRTWSSGTSPRPARTSCGSPT